MKRIQWSAKRGAQVEVGSVIAADERAAMKAVLASRAWRGRDWKLRVGDLYTIFDEEDVGLLAGTIGDEHARDDVGTTRKVASDRPKRTNIWGPNPPTQINALPCKCWECGAEQWEEHSDKCAHRWGTCPHCGAAAGDYHTHLCSRRPPPTYAKEKSFGPGDLVHIDLGGGTIIDMRKPRFGIKLGMNDPDRLREMRAIMHGRAGEIECSVVMPCCKKTQQVRFPMPQSNTMRSCVSMKCPCGANTQIELELDPGF